VAAFGFIPFHASFKTQLMGALTGGMQHPADGDRRKTDL
jgi:hypothetical protein